MFRSIIDDIKHNYSIGNMVVKLIIINVILFMIAALITAFSHGGPAGQFIANNFFISSSPSVFIYKPWTFISYMFLHIGFFHILWNMVGLNIFGTILGDLLGDRRVLPLYILGGLFGALVFIIAYNFLNQALSSNMLGASASVLALASASAIVAPDYNIRLILFGNVKLKYIVLAFIFFDLIGTQGFSNTGGHFAHLGGISFGLIFAFLLQKGTDITTPLQNLFSYFSNWSYDRPKMPAPRAKLRVEHRSEKLGPKTKSNQEIEMDFQERLDFILDKIKQRGYDKLTLEEKDFLNKASKNQ